MGFGIQPTNCQRVMFDSQYTGVSNARITGLVDVAPGVRQWKVESQGTHRGMCVISSKGGKSSPTGETPILPFSFIVIEVPYPTYPS